MSLENFRVPRTPESRTPYVLAVLAIFGVIGAAWNAFVDFRYNVESLIVVAAAAVGYAVWRSVRQGRRSSRPQGAPRTR